MLHHKISAFIIIIILCGLGYYAYRFFSTSEIGARYIVISVQKGALSTSVLGSGQISTFDQIDIKPKVSQNINAILTRESGFVEGDAPLFTLDARDAEKAVRDAKVGVESAILQLESLQQSTANDAKLVSDGFNEIAETFLDLPAAMTGLKDALFDSTISSYENLIDANDRSVITPFIQAAENSYARARTFYDAAFAHYHTISRYDSTSSIIMFIDETANTATAVADGVKNMINVIDFVNDYNTVRDRKVYSVYSALLVKYKNAMAEYTAKINPHITKLSNIQTSLQNAPLAIRTQMLVIQQRKNALADTEENLAYYTVRALFSGTIAKINVKVGDFVSANTSLETLVTNKKIAEIDLNEVDIAKVKVGQKVTLTFDAISDFTMTGTVTHIDTVGTANQGVVTYGVRVVLDKQDNRIKPGMSVSATIITETVSDVFAIPSGAIKSQGRERYVEVLEGVIGSSESMNRSISSENMPVRQHVTTGISNDTMTVITEGLNEGDIVVVRTLASS